MTGQAEIQAVAFDLDGTLVDSVGDLADAANAMRAALNMPPLSEETLLSFIGDGIARLVHRALTDDHESFADDELWERGYTLYARYYAARLSNRTRPYPQVRDTLALLKAMHLPLATVTNKSERFARPILKNLGLDDCIDLLVGGDTLPEKKPSALPLLHVCEASGIEAKNLLMVGDSENDMLAAKNAGCASCLVTFGYGNHERLMQNPDTRPDWSVDEFIDIYRRLKAAS